MSLRPMAGPADGLFPQAVLIVAVRLWRDTEELAALRRSQRVFLPQRPQADCDDEYRLWKKAVSRACHWVE